MKSKTTAIQVFPRVVAGQLPAWKTGRVLRNSLAHLSDEMGNGKNLGVRQKIPLHPTLQQPATFSAVTLH